MNDKEKIITVWITKHALTQGIEEKKAKIDEADKNMIKIYKNDVISEFYHGEDKDWHKTKEAAIKRAKEMRDRKIKNLEKQIEKLKNMKFE